MAGEGVRGRGAIKKFRSFALTPLSGYSDGMPNHRISHSYRK